MEVRHPGILLNLLMSTHQIVDNALDPLEVGVAGVVGEMGEPKIIGAEGGGHECLEKSTCKNYISSNLPNRSCKHISLSLVKVYEI